ncbi:MAG: CaiB/BaiF CoA transferase family protein [Burkholderiales bacterium]
MTHASSSAPSSAGDPVSATARSEAGPKPFAGVRVLDFTHFLAGPFSTFQLAVQGAEVIKVEPVSGDAMRLSPISREWSERQLGPAWMAVNANKRSITLDLGKPEAVEIVNRLVREVDIVCENFRPGVLERKGMGWSQLSKINPRLIYCGISGFGSTGPERGTASFDGKIQAMSGLMSITGDEQGGPMRAGFALADITTGMTAAFAMASALYQRTHTGRGQFVDVAMLDAMLNFMAPQVAEYTVMQYMHPQYGNRSTSRKPTADRFACGDGHIVLAVLTDKQFDNLLRALGRSDLLGDPRFSDWFTRTENEVELRRIIEEAMRAGSAKDWEQRLTAADVPCATVWKISEIVNHPQVQHRGLVQPAQTPYGEVRLAGAGFRMAHGNGGIEGPVATPGADTQRVLASIGYDETQIRQLQADRVI